MTIGDDWGRGRHYAVGEAWCEFGALPLVAYMDDDLLRRYAALALAIPPRETSQWIFQHCLIVPVHDGRAVPPCDSEGRYLLLFPVSVIHGEPSYRVIHLILHEAAHAYLRHGEKEGLPPSYEEGKKRERQANRLVAQWMRAAQYNKQWVEAKLSGRT